MRKYIKRRLSSRKSKLSLRKKKLSLRKMKTNRNKMSNKKMKTNRSKVGVKKSINKYRNKNSIKKSNLRGGGKTVLCPTCGYKARWNLDNNYYKYFYLLKHFDKNIQYAIIYVALNIKNNIGVRDHYKYIKCAAQYVTDAHAMVVSETAIRAVHTPVAYGMGTWCDSKKTQFVLDFVENICKLQLKKRCLSQLPELVEKKPEVVYDMDNLVAQEVKPKVVYMDNLVAQEVVQSFNDVPLHSLVINFCNTIFKYYFQVDETIYTNFESNINSEKKEDFISSLKNEISIVEKAFIKLSEKFNKIPSRAGLLASFELEGLEGDELKSKRKTQLNDIKTKLFSPE